MIVLHGIWIPPMDVPGDDTGAGKLAIWGEGSPISVSQPKPGRRAKHQTSKPRTHPFASTTNELLLPLGELTGDIVSLRFLTIQLLITIPGIRLFSEESSRRQGVGADDPLPGA